MPETPYTYDVSTETANGRVNPDDLISEILASAIVIAQFVMLNLFIMIIVEDFDLDGWPDLGIGAWNGRDRLYMGDGDRFFDETPRLSLDVARTVAGAGWRWGRSSWGCS